MLSEGQGVRAGTRRPDYHPAEMPAWAVWVLLGVGFAGAELLTPGLFIAALLVLPALAAALLAVLGAGAAVQLLVFIVGSAASVLVLRPLARSHVRMPPQLRTGAAALVGARATVLEQVDDTAGRVRIGGEEWSARAYLDGQVIAPGARVEVVEIKGAIALVLE
jgi:membrane protein implicated in regulation of membrane protease activity